MAKANQAVQGAVRGVLDAAPDGAARERIALDLLGVAGLLSREPRVRAALTDPSLAVEAKHGLEELLFASRVGPGAVEALAAVVEHQRLRGRAIVEVVEDVAWQALLDVADAEGSLADVEDELFGFARVVDGNAELYAVLTDHAMSAERKRALVETLLANRANRLTVALVGYLVEQDQGGHLAAMAEDMVTEAAARRGGVVAEVTSAVALDEGQRRRLADRLAELTGTRVQLRVTVDPAVVGSLAVRIGDEVYDGTVKRQLELAGERLGAA